MVKNTLVALLVLWGFISISFAGSKPDMQEGEWKITTKTEMPGMPMPMPPVTHTQCLTNDDLIPQSNQQGGGDCRISDIEVDGNTVSWTMHCTGQGGETKGSGKITYSGDRFEGTMKMVMTQANMQMVNYISGIRIGDCE